MGRTHTDTLHDCRKMEVLHVSNYRSFLYLKKALKRRAFVLVVIVNNTEGEFFFSIRTRQKLSHLNPTFLSKKLISEKWEKMEKYYNKA